MRWIVLTGLIVMALAGALMLYRQGEKAVASQDWRRVQGTVTESLVDRRAARSNERQWDYKAIIHYRYEVDGRPYAGTQRRFPEPGYSTTEALAGGARDADAASACIILEQFLRSLP